MKYGKLKTLEMRQREKKKEEQEENKQTILTGEK